jgi:hypothetical protein
MNEIKAYECETCGELWHDKNRFYKCVVCGVELCRTCGNEIASNYPSDSFDITTIKICDDCYDNLSDKFVELCLKHKV